MTNKDLLKMIEPFVNGYQYKRTKKTLIDNSNPLLYKIIEPQKYSGKINGEEVFTMNIGIFVPKVYQMIFEIPQEIITAHCLIDFRIDELMQIKLGNKISKNWIYKDIDNLKIDLYRTVKEFIIPFFDEIMDIKDIDDFVESNYLTNNNIGIAPLQRAILKFLANKTVDGRNMIKNIIDTNNDNKEYKEKVIAIGKILTGQSFG